MAMEKKKKYYRSKLTFCFKNNEIETLVLTTPYTPNWQDQKDLSYHVSRSFSNGDRFFMRNLNEDNLTMTGSISPLHVGIDMSDVLWYSLDAELLPETDQ